MKKSIRLDNNQSNFEIGFACDSYLDASGNDYSYRMVGVSDDWIILPAGQQYVRFNNLPVDSTYTITEGDLPTGFVFDSSAIAVTKGTGTTETFVAGRTSTGLIETTNSELTITYTNEYELIDINN